MQAKAAPRAAVNFPTENVGSVPAQPGAGLVRLEIPSVGLSAIVLEGIGPEILRIGVGHVPGTSWPAQPGNVVLAGHRDTFFRPLRKISTCAEVLLDTASRTYRYRVTAFEIVDPHDVNEMTSHGKDELTLITCYPYYYVGPAPQRFVVHAESALAAAKCQSS